MTNQNRDINVQPQAKLSFKKVYDLVRSGVMHRMLRSSLTMSVILLAVAFFMSTLCENVIVNKIAAGVDKEIAHERSSITLLNHLYNKPNILQFSHILSTVAVSENASAYDEAIAVLKWDSKRLDRLIALCQTEQAYMQFFKHMKINQRNMLIGKMKDHAIFTSLQDEKQYHLFQKKLEPLRSLKLPGKEADLAHFLQGFPQFVLELEICQKIWCQAIDALHQDTNTLCAGQKIESWLASADDSDFATWSTLISSHAFYADAQSLAKIRPDMKNLETKNEITAILLSPQLQSLWNEKFLRKDTLETKYAMLSNSDTREVINASQDKRIYTIEELSALQESIAYQSQLSDLQAQLAPKTERQSSALLSGKQTFLLIISFCVCMVGIANAMLMSITERFREIATMKCLGATDSFILIQFMMEACFQGVAGGVFGIFVGFMLCMLKTTAAYGAYPFYYFPMSGLIICGIVSLFIGVFLAIMASLYPSWAASRMAPMEAMRIE